MQPPGRRAPGRLLLLLWGIREKRRRNAPGRPGDPPPRLFGPKAWGQACGRREAGNRGTAGFTLLEVLIAFIIAGLAIAALMQAGGSGLAATKAAVRYEEAVSRARSHLASATHGAALAPSDNHGDDGRGFLWRVRVTPIATTTLQPLGPLRRPGVPVTLYAVSVWITWRDGNADRTVRLDTEQIGEVAR
jgi:general secretion pathway protein I